MTKINEETRPVYDVSPLIKNDLRKIEAAMGVLRSYFTRGQPLTSSEKTAQYLTLKIALLPHEVFGCIFLDAQHHVIADEILFTGTLDAATIYPREVLKAVFNYNAGAVIFYHNHPSGLPEPSSADRTITNKLKSALNTIDVRVLDHVIVGGAETFSFAERGYI